MFMQITDEKKEQQEAQESPEDYRQTFINEEHSTQLSEVSPVALGD
jgi:hypothetical protein